MKGASIKILKKNLKLAKVISKGGLEGYKKAMEIHASDKFRMFHYRRWKKYEKQAEDLEIAIAVLSESKKYNKARG